MSETVLVMAKAYPPNLGGVETYSEQVAKAYSRRGLLVSVITQHEGPLGWSNRDGVHIYNVGPGPQWKVAVRMSSAVRRFVCNTPVRFVHATTWRVALPVIVAAKNVPLYVSVHGREVATASGMKVWLMKRVFRRAQRCVVISNTSYEYCSRVLPRLKEIGVVSWNGINFPLGVSRPEVLQGTDRPSGTKFKLLCACRLIETKNIDSAIRAVRLLSDRGFKVVLEIIGDGPKRSSLESLAADLGLEEVVTFVGRVPLEEMPSRYMGVDAFVHPQRHDRDPRLFESFCLAIVDAMSFGVATIGGREGAPSEYIVNGENGLLVDGDPDGIANAVMLLATSPELRRKIAEAGRRWALESLSWDKHVEPLLEASGFSGSTSC